MNGGRTGVLSGILLLAGAAFCVCFAPPRAGAASLTPKEILDRVDDLFRGESSHGRATMTVTTAHWTRSLSLDFWSRGKDDSLIRITAPKKEEGTATLRSGNDVWNYLPKVKRVIKLPSSMMSASWMGSHFTNDDLVKESRMTVDYTFEVSFEGEREGRAVTEILCHPKPEAAVVWGKVVVLVERPSYLPLQVFYYDEDMNLARTLHYSEMKRFRDRDLPAKLTAVPADKPSESTVVFYEEIRFNVDPPPDLFSLRTLQR